MVTSGQLLGLATLPPREGNRVT